jgi:hypothetical protein
VGAAKRLLSPGRGSLGHSLVFCLEAGECHGSVYEAASCVSGVFVIQRIRQVGPGNLLLAHQAPEDASLVKLENITVIYS